MSLKDRCVPKGDCSIADVNSFLDQLNMAQEKADKVQILRSLLRRSTAEELKWIVRVILKGTKDDQLYT